MNTIAYYNSDRIREAVKEIKKSKPEFNVMLDLYEKIFIAQEESKQDVYLDDFIIPDEVLQLKLKEQFPLINIQQFNIDKHASETLFRVLCGILLGAAGELSESVKKIINLTENRQLNIGDLFSEFLNQNESRFDNIQNEFSIDKTLLGFIVYNSLSPSISLFSEKISVYLDKRREWNKGFCPVCGSMPELSMFEENGKRFLFCGFCNHKWSSKRIYCPFCGNTDHGSLQYHEIENEEEYRVDLCDKCKKYIKTVDIKKTSRVIYPPLERHSTHYIDVKFAGMGFKHGNAVND